MIGSKHLNVLIYTPRFYPSIGGMETVMMMLALGLHKAGHTVTIVAEPYNGAVANEKHQGINILRGISKSAFLSLLRHCDKYIMSSLAFSRSWTLFIKPLNSYIIHHSCTFLWTGKSRSDWFKRLVAFFTHNITVSNIVAKSLRLSHYHTINNPYNDSIFLLTNTSPRHDFVYLGRLSFEKGVDTLIRAFAQYRKHHTHDFHLSVIGCGGELESLKSLTAKEGVEPYIHFKGLVTGVALCELLNQHHTLIIPTRCQEAFGVAALEGMACGCFCIGSDGDGVKEAVGNLGCYFKKNDINSLAKALLTAEHKNTDDFASYIKATHSHLARFTPKVITQQYIQHIIS